MIDIKITSEAFDIGDSSIAHYGVSAKNGAPGRGSGRYPLGSGANPRSENNSIIGTTKKGGLASNIRNKISEHVHEFKEQRKKEALDREYMSNKMKGKAKTEVYDREAMLKEIDIYSFNKHKDHIAKDNPAIAKYKKYRDRYCKKDEATGLYLDEPADGVSKEEYNEWKRSLNEHTYDSPYNIGYVGDFGRLTNCAVCVVAKEMNDRGYVTNSKAYTGGFPSHMFFEAFKAKECCSSTDIKDIVDYIESQGSGARGLFACQWKHGGGHAMSYSVSTNYRTKEPIVKIYDPQQGIDIGYFSIKNNAVEAHGPWLPGMVDNFSNKKTITGFYPFDAVRLDNADFVPDKILKLVE